MNKIEQIARAIYERRNGHGCKPWSIQPKAHKAPYMDDARAAIEAMREPTEEMVDMVDLPGLIGDPEVAIPRTWRTMIDAALNPS